MEIELGTLLFDKIPNFIADLYEFVYEFFTSEIRLAILPGFITDSQWGQSLQLMSFSLWEIFLVITPATLIIMWIAKLILDAIPIV